MSHVTLRLPEGSDIGGLNLGYREVVLLFNIGQYPGGGQCLLVKADGDLTTINSNDLIADLQAYNLFAE